MIGRIARFRLDATAAVIAKKAPAGRAIFKRAVADEFPRCTGGRFHHTDVVEQSFAVAIEQAESEFVPERGFPGLAGSSDGAVTIGLPARGGRFVTGSPGSGIGVVGAGIAQ